MTRESGSKANLRILWMSIDDEVPVRRHRVHARGGVRNLSIQRRNSRGCYGLCTLLDSLLGVV